MELRSPLIPADSKGSRPHRLHFILRPMLLLFLLGTFALSKASRLIFTVLPSGSPPFPAPIYDLDFLGTPPNLLQKRYPAVEPSHQNIWSPIGNSEKHTAGHILANWVAVGDSWSAGIGAGTQVDWNYKCARYSESYPMQLSRYEPMTREFDFLACTGDRIGNITDQVCNLKRRRERANERC